MKLTQFEYEILKDIIAGARYKDIAKKLGTSETKVLAVVNMLHCRYKVCNRLELVEKVDLKNIKIKERKNKIKTGFKKISQWELYIGNTTLNICEYLYILPLYLAIQQSIHI